MNTGLHFRCPLPAEEYGAFYEYRASRYPPDLWIDRRKCTRSIKIVWQMVLTKSCTGWLDVPMGIITRQSSK
ncbi:hypothetical protein TNCV_3957801 [Trichonephila clavipes]|nr:hypothetical protein TNCV_3957801 [Trichonephila clavipes]